MYTNLSIKDQMILDGLRARTTAEMAAVSQCAREALINADQGLLHSHDPNWAWGAGERKAIGTAKPLRAAIATFRSIGEQLIQAADSMEPDLAKWEEFDSAHQHE